ncbi:porin family protein [Afifella pfennigii]|uniref:hypothetical protein n=1 Tax=Afifella pfennigii TaxID=209897 RepID=UPI0005524ED2|nr:hypothetical protein [Afifella pfennigii]
MAELMHNMLRPIRALALLGMVFALALPALADTQGNASITYEDVLARPDDLALTYAYARQEADRGRLEQSAGALERLLLLEPNWDTARLFYAIVLYRLDDLKGAERELLILKDRPLSAADASEVARYLALAQSGQKTTRFTGALSFGAAVDTNPAFASSADNGFTAGTLVPLTARERVDGAFVAAATMRVEHTLPTGQGDFVFAEVDGWLNEQFHVDQASFLTGRAEAGATLVFRDLAVTPAARFGAYVLDDDLFYDEYGGTLKASYVVNPRLSVFAKGAALWQDYHRTSLSSVGSARDGWEIRAGGGLLVRPSQRLNSSLAAYFLNKNAASASFSYRGLELHGRQVVLLGSGQYVLAEGQYWRVDYERPDPAVLPGVTRKDDRFRARLAYGLPLETAFGAVGVELPQPIGEMNFQLGGEYYRQNSNIANYDGDNWSGDVLVTKRFAF